MNTRLLAAVFIALAFVLFAMGCASSSYPVTKAASKAQKGQQARLQQQFP